MQKITKIMLLLALVVSASVATNSVYGQTLVEPNVAFNTIEIVALSGVVIGAIISVAGGYWDRKDKAIPFSKSKLASSLLIAIMLSISMVNFVTLPEQTNGLSALAIFAGFLLMGYGADKGLTKLDNN